MFSMIKVQGTSMVPRLQHGDFVFISHWQRSLKVGDLVVVDHALYRFIVKRVLNIDCNGLLWIGGENETSLQPQELGWVAPHRLVGKVLFCICANHKPLRSLFNGNKSNTKPS
jgi:nickel-type superoxide dismutase maturation protease